MKVLAAFPEVDLYWLLNGKGTFPSEKTGHTPDDKKSDTPVPAEKQIAENRSEIERIIIFFKDGSFRDYEN